MKILVAGAGGMLGTALLPAIARAWPEAVVLQAGREVLAVATPSALLGHVVALAPGLVVNAAADTDVEGAESDPRPAFSSNAELPGLLASACRDLGAPLVHVSSTGCYGAWKDGPYDDYDTPRPTTAHHRSKIAGEHAVRASGAEHLIVRTGWLFGGAPGHRKNFVFKRVLEASKAGTMRSDPTQTGNPTFVDDLAATMLTVFLEGVRGTCNIVSGGSATRLDYVREIVALSGLPCRVEPSDGGFARRADVSPNEAAINLRLELLGLDTMSSWRDGLRRYVATLRGTPAWREIEGSAR